MSVKIEDLEKRISDIEESLASDQVQVLRTAQGTVQSLVVTNHGHGRVRIGSSPSNAIEYSLAGISGSSHNDLSAMITTLAVAMANELEVKISLVGTGTGFISDVTVQN